MIKWDGLDDAVIGESTSGQLVYDVDKVIHLFMDRDGRLGKKKSRSKRSKKG